MKRQCSTKKRIWIDDAGPIRAMKKVLLEFINQLDICSNKKSALDWRFPRSELRTGLLEQNYCWVKIASGKNQIISQENNFSWVFFPQNIELQKFRRANAKLRVEQKTVIKSAFCHINCTCKFIAQFFLRGSQHLCFFSFCDSEELSLSKIFLFYKNDNS